MVKKLCVRPFSKNSQKRVRMSHQISQTPMITEKTNLLHVIRWMPHTVYDDCHFSQKTECKGRHRKWTLRTYLHHIPML